MKELLLTFGAAMTPVFELRGAIPLGLLHYKIDWFAVYIIAVLGNIIPIIPILFFLDKGTDFLRRVTLFDRILDWLFTRTRKKSGVIEKYEWWGLMIFVAIPLPGTGAWTGCIAAYLFGFTKLRSFLAIMFGVILAGILVTAASLGIFNVI